MVLEITHSESLSLKVRYFVKRYINFKIRYSSAVYSVQFQFDNLNVIFWYFT